MSLMETREHAGMDPLNRVLDIRRGRLLLTYSFERLSFEDVLEASVTPKPFISLSSILLSPLHFPLLPLFPLNVQGLPFPISLNLTGERRAARTEKMLRGKIRLQPLLPLSSPFPPLFSPFLSLYPGAQEEAEYTDWVWMVICKVIHASVHSLRVTEGKKKEKDENKGWKIKG